MFRLRFLLLALLILTLSSVSTPLAAAECGGTNLIPQLPAEDRATLDARAKATPYHTGLFWRATKGDTDLSIFGTFHFHHDQTERQLAALMPHAHAADTTWFEMSYNDLIRFEKQSKSDPSLMFITSGPTIPEMMEEADWQRLRTRMAALGIPSFMAAKFKPIFLAMMLGSSPCHMRAQMHGSKGIDEQLSRILHGENRPTRSIEDPATTMQLLDDFTRDEQIAMVKLSLDLSQDPDDLQATLVTLYQQEKIALLWEYGRLLSLKYGGPSAGTDFEQFEQALLTGRNLEWAKTVEAEMTGTRALIAVGAGHLPGEYGLLNLLAQQGFTIERRELYGPPHPDGPPAVERLPKR